MKRMRLSQLHAMWKIDAQTGWKQCHRMQIKRPIRKLVVALGFVNVWRKAWFGPKLLRYLTVLWQPPTQQEHRKFLQMLKPLATMWIRNLAAWVSKCRYNRGRGPGHYLPSKVSVIQKTTELCWSSLNSDYRHHVMPQWGILWTTIK